MITKSHYMDHTDEYILAEIIENWQFNPDLTLYVREHIIVA